MSILPSNPAWESTLFCLYPRFSGTASGFKELQLLLICQSARLLIFACEFMSTRRSIQPSTLLIWVWGRQTATFHSILNSLYCTLTAHETHENGWVGVNASKFVTLRAVASFSAGTYFSTPEQLRFCIRNVTVALNRSECSFHSLSTF